MENSQNTKPGGTIDPEWMEILSRLPKAEESIRQFQNAGIRAEQGNQRRSRNGVEKLATVKFTEAPITHGFSEEEISTIARSSPLVARVDIEKATKALGELAFRLGKMKYQAADASRSIVEELRAAGWTHLEFENAVAVLGRTNDVEILRELKFATIIGSLLFNQVRNTIQVQAGRLHVLPHAVRIAKSHNSGIRKIFQPVRIAGDDAVLFMVKKEEPRPA